MDAIPGWPELLALVGAEPAFADAHILDLHISLAGEASLTVRTFAMTDDRNFDYERPVIVEITMRGLEAVKLEDFAPASVLDELKIERLGLEWVISLDPCYGVGGTLRAREIVVHSHQGRD
jgi:hypothetical protein